MGREFELKYHCDSETFAAIRKKYGYFLSISMETTYYDTPDGDFQKRRWMLRRRLENRRCVCTLKTPLPDGSRGEWEVEEGDIALAPRKLCALGAPELLLKLVQKGLVPMCAARFTRLAATLSLPACRVELALDQGHLLAGQRQLPFWEVEVEGKEGPDQAVADFARQLAREFSLTPQPWSKAQRAFALALAQSDGREKNGQV